MASGQTKWVVNGVNVNVVIAGQGPDVLLHHGFPDSADVWRHQIPFLVNAGYRVIAPEQHGFCLLDRSSATGACTIEHDISDLVTLLDTLGIKKVRLVGHDWAAAVCWQLCIKHPDRVFRYVALSVGHPAAYANERRWSKVGKVRVPVMGVWGEGDVMAAEAQLIDSEQYVSGPWRYERVGDRAGHWLMLTKPDVFNALLLDYLKEDLN